MKNMRKTLPLTLSAMLTALGVVLLWLGGLIEVLDLSVAAVVALFVFFAHRELPRPCAYMIYLGTSLLSVLLLPVKGAAIFYAAFAGWYPMLKYHLDHLPSLPAWCLKLLVLNATAALLLFGGSFLLMLPLEALEFYLFVFAAGNFSFVLYDILLGRLLILYAARLRPRVQRFLYH